MVSRTSNRRLKKLDWQYVAQRKCKAILSSIPADWRLDQADIQRCGNDVTAFIEQLLDQKTRSITGLHTEQLLGRLLDNSLRAVEVVAAFCKRTAYAHQLVGSKPRFWA